MTSLKIAELTATCNALGYAVNGRNKYFLDKECKEAVRELIRFLRRDDETHEIRRHLGTARILQTDLVPILIQHHEDEEMQELLLRLLVNLTTPALLLYNEELPVDKVSRQYYLQIMEQLQEFKQAFSKQQFWNVLCDKLSALLKMDWVDRGEEKSLTIVRILILIRNVLHVPTNSKAEKRADNDATVHDQVLWALYESRMINLVLYIATSENEKQYYFHVLEIISLMLRDQNAEALAGVSVQRTVNEMERDKQELTAARQKEVDEKRKNTTKHIAARHSRFGGTFVVRGVKSISDNDLIVHSLNKETYLSFDRNKAKRKTPKNRLPMQSEKGERRSPVSVRVLMKEFCIEFLNGAYNHLMHYVREMFHRGKAQDNDESLYFWALRFFMEFNRHYKFEVKLISETMHVSVFHFTQERLEEWRSKIAIDKKKIALWSKRMHLGLNAYRELLNTLFRMYQSAEHAVKESAHTIMSNIFYVVEYRELLLGLLSMFDEIKFSREYLKDLIEANHIFVKMLEHFCKRHRTLVVQKKTKRVRKRNSKQSAKKKAILTLEPSDEMWNEMEPRIADIFTNKIELNIQSMPFDAASEIPFDEQKVEAMRTIRLHLIKAEVEEAISLFRACREVWPENECFGASYMPPEEECTALQEIFFTDIGFPAGANIQSTTSANEDEEDSADGEDGEDGQDERMMTGSMGEQSFQFVDFVIKFVRPKIVHACCLLLSQFDQNNVFTNHCIARLLHRIAFDCKYAAILFQASVFRTFQRVLNSSDERHTELKDLAVYVVRKFTQVAQRNGKVYMEMLFWKTNKEAYEIEEGYGALISTKSAKSEKKKKKKKKNENENENENDNDDEEEGVRQSQDEEGDDPDRLDEVHRETNWEEEEEREQQVEISGLREMENDSSVAAEYRNETEDYEEEIIASSAARCGRVIEDSRDQSDSDDDTSSTERSSRRSEDVNEISRSSQQRECHMGRGRRRTVLDSDDESEVNQEHERADEGLPAKQPTMTLHSESEPEEEDELIVNEPEEDAINQRNAEQQ